MTNKRLPLNFLQSAGLQLTACQNTNTRIKQDEFAYGRDMRFGEMAFDAREFLSFFFCRPAAASLTLAVGDHLANILRCGVNERVRSYCLA